MSESRDGRSDPAEWLRFAEEDLGLATRVSKDSSVSPRAACWHAQQAAEKALKAALLEQGSTFPRTHNLLALRALLNAERAEQLRPEDLAELTAWAVEARYPGDWDEPDREAAVAAARMAADIVAAATDWIGV
ncbi:MAG: HEPN domain-containing protein [Actinomycetota bacterium]|nr:HEPN domain-containing protein [Actinomycetota bacterium]